jgi:CRISPR system Cascade subunit CasB
MTQPAADAPLAARPTGTLGRFVASRVTAWQRDYIRRRPQALATLARLRRGIGKDVGALPELWQYTLDGLPGAAPPDDAPPSWTEQAAYTALTLFALHQQSRREEMHEPGQSLGTAVRLLRSRAATDEAVRRRFEALGTAETFSEVVHHARGLITQLRGEAIPLDYGMLAEDLFRLQTSAADRVRLQWGRDFHRSTHSRGPDQPDDPNSSPAASAAPTDDDEET